MEKVLEHSQLVQCKLQVLPAALQLLTSVQSGLVDHVWQEPRAGLAVKVNLLLQARHDVIGQRLRHLHALRASHPSTAVCTIEHRALDCYRGHCSIPLAAENHE